MIRNNPVTSVDASESALRDASTTRDRVLAIVRVHGPLTLDELVDHYRRYRSMFEWKLVSDQSVRSRCAELAHDELVYALPAAVGKSRFGKAAKLWRAVSV